MHTEIYPIIKIDEHQVTSTTTLRTCNVRTKKL